MDDIITIYAENNRWDAARVLQSQERAYHPPLKLEEAKPDTYLESRFVIEHNKIRFRLKNDNEDGSTKVWRYQHFDSNTPFLQKRATLTACLRKTQSMASDPRMMMRGALAKIAEFRKLRYPISVIDNACTFLAASQGEGTWITIRNAFRESENDGPKAED